MTELASVFGRIFSLKLRNFVIFKSRTSREKSRKFRDFLIIFAWKSRAKRSKSWILTVESFEIFKISLVGACRLFCSCAPQIMRWAYYGIEFLLSPRATIGRSDWAGPFLVWGGKIIEIFGNLSLCRGAKWRIFRFGEIFFSFLGILKYSGQNPSKLGFWPVTGFVYGMYLRVLG